MLYVVEMIYLSYLAAWPFAKVGTVVLGEGGGWNELRPIL